MILWSMEIFHLLSKEMIWIISTILFVQHKISGRVVERLGHYLFNYLDYGLISPKFERVTEKNKINKCYDWGHSPIRIVPSIIDFCS